MTEASVFRRKKGWMNLKIDKIVEETHDTKTFFLVDAEEGGRAFDYIAGQYLTVRYDTIEKKPLVRSYTMSSSPCETGYCALTVKRVEKGVVSNWMCDHLKVGDILKARGSIGKFHYDAKIHKPHLIMVAAGSGVTPFISIIREYKNRLSSSDTPEKMTLLVAYRSEKDLILWSEIEDGNKCPGVSIVTTLTRENKEAEGFIYGRPDKEMLSKIISGDYQNSTFMTCGPEALMDMVVEHCAENGTDNQQVLQESFF